MAGSEFGRMVRSRRDRVPPEAAGLPAGGRRRAAGLRREELAMLAGVSADYVTRLEQGRAENPSPQVVEALARALRLSTPERGLLFRLAGLSEPARGTVPTAITPGVRRMLDRLGGVPVAVHDAVWTLLVANGPYAALMGDPSGWRGMERNGVWRTFLGRPGRVEHSTQPRADLEAALVGDLRSAAARYPSDPRVRELVAGLRAGSDRFAALWDAGTVGRHEPAVKTVHHPEAGLLTLDCDILTVNGGDLRVMIYTAEPGTDEAERLARLTGSDTRPVLD
ncbi:helix-turn-helix transcriptional regulator [Streptomyces sp. RFCAC02]|uniref:helix-turn-helix transcriptional regulator n=1 Tax=Streptomyces sp. RFCAC02 TaxID=2499143 RepID=UPI0010219ED1|nr:helix-turn-helix transcriptional regulator [Streptomyces sp. RFCAC02]